MTWPHSADARPRIYPQTRNLTRRTRAWTICRRAISVYWQLAELRLKHGERVLTVHLRGCSELAWWLVISFFFFFLEEFFYFFSSPPPAHCLSLRGTRRLSRRCAITSKHVAKEMWSDTEGWRRVCSLKLRCSWVGQGGDTACLIDYLIRLN